MKEGELFIVSSSILWGKKEATKYLKPCRFNISAIMRYLAFSKVNSSSDVC